MKLEPGALVWPSKVIKAVEALSKGPAHSRVDSGVVLSIAISDLRTFLSSLSQPASIHSLQRAVVLRTSFETSQGKLMRAISHNRYLGIRIFWYKGKEKFGNSYHQWQTDAPNFLIDGHYPVRELWDRATNCWDRILAHDSKSVLVVAHNAMNQALIASAIGLGTDCFRRLLQSNCGVSVWISPQVLMVDLHMYALIV